ncbi:uncharacterized protein LOC119269884 isoform X2 [Triticum dicoccoides]|uniref:uncharacterized protein LOC119269884 isoform X2 n=1 Tax=Triticum dicoccoides TaxID=85692 RepID=UPI00188ECD89|nr:uncharacterized protein LOC119269884 isoform X2 [Triticum dicoccoides]
MIIYHLLLCTCLFEFMRLQELRKLQHQFYCTNQCAYATMQVYSQVSCMDKAFPRGRRRRPDQHSPAVLPRPDRHGRLGRRSKGDGRWGDGPASDAAGDAAGARPGPAHGGERAGQQQSHLASVIAKNQGKYGSSIKALVSTLCPCSASLVLIGHLGILFWQLGQLVFQQSAVAGPVPDNRTSDCDRFYLPLGGHLIWTPSSSTTAAETCSCCRLRPARTPTTDLTPTPISSRLLLESQKATREDLRQ